MNLQNNSLFPKNNYLILTQFDKRTEEMRGGLVVPISIIEEKDTTSWAKVHAACEGSGYKVGMTVIFSKFVPIQFRLEEIEYLACKESDIICIIP